MFIKNRAELFGIQEAKSFDIKLDKLSLDHPAISPIPLPFFRLLKV